MKTILTPNRCWHFTKAWTENLIENGNLTKWKSNRAGNIDFFTRSRLFLMTRYVSVARWWWKLTRLREKENSFTWKMNANFAESSRRHAQKRAESSLEVSLHFPLFTFIFKSHGFLRVHSPSVIMKTNADESLHSNQYSNAEWPVVWDKCLISAV